jgi:hypothetical protein
MLRTLEQTTIGSPQPRVSGEQPRLRIGAAGEPNGPSDCLRAKAILSSLWH